MKMAKKVFEQIEESTESKENRKSEIFSGTSIKSLRFPKEDSEGFVTGYFTEFIPTDKGQYITDADGEVKIDFKTKLPRVAEQDQFEFVFTVECEHEGETLDLRFWTGRCIDGVYSKKRGGYSKLTTFLCAVGLINKKSLHPKFRVDDEQKIMDKIAQLFEGKFRFKTEMVERLHKPILDSFEYLGHDDDDVNTEDQD